MESLTCRKLRTRRQNFSLKQAEFSQNTAHFLRTKRNKKKKKHFSLNDSVLTDISCSVDKKPNIPKPFAVAANYNNEEYVESPPHPGSLHPAASTVPFLQIKRSGNKK